MPAQALASQILGALSGFSGTAGSGYTADTPVQVNTIVAAEITKYLVANAQVVTDYTGVTPAGSPEKSPCVHQVSGSVAPPGVATSYESWVDEIAQNISVGFQTLPGSPVIPQAPHMSFQVPIPKISVFCPQSVLKAAHEGNPQDPALDVWTKIAQGIFDMINTQVSAPFPAGMAGTGVATVTKLILI